MLDRVDVMIPTHNRWEELCKTLDKLIQFDVNIENIYVFDDASNDSTKEIKKFYPEVNYYRTENSKGVIYARNFLWNKVKADYVLSLDDDSNPISKETIIKAIKILNADEKVGVFSFNTIHQPVISENDYLNKQSNEIIRQIRLFIACGCLFKRSFITDLQYYAEEKLYFHGEELDCSLRGYKKGYKVVTDDSLFVHHRVDWSIRNKKIFGKYGKIWRSSNGFSANLIIAGLYYPLGFDFLFILLYIGKRFIRFLLFKGHFFGFFGGLFRFLFFIPFFLFHSKKLKYDSFISWIKLETY